MKYPLRIILFLLLISYVGFTSQTLEQDLSKITDGNGKIVSVHELDINTLDTNNQAYKITYKSDSLNVVGFIVKPSQVEKSACIIFNRGGNREFSKINNKDLKYFSFFASKGYTVIASQYRGNDGGEGKEEFGGKDVNDVLHLIPLIKSLKFIDTDRIYMLGYSRGGMMTYLAIKNDIKIKAAVVVGGVSDLTQLWRDRDIGMQSVMMDLIGCSPMECPDEYKNRSAVFWADKINVPLLILHGESDTNVDVSQAKELADKLKTKKKKYKLVLYPYGDHSLFTHRADRNDEIFNWFNKYQ